MHQNRIFDSIQTYKIYCITQAVTRVETKLFTIVINAFKIRAKRQLELKY